MRVLPEIPSVPTFAECQAALGSWWFHYDHAAMAEFAEHIGPEMHFRSRTASGATAYEDFVRADLRGKDAVLRWHIEHRTNSPYPLRHNATSVFATASTDAGTSVASYLFVTRTVDGKPANLASGVVRATAVRAAHRILFAEMDVVLDTIDSTDVLGASAPEMISVGE